LTESKNIIIFELEQSLSQTLKENLEEKSEPDAIKIPFIKRESKQIEKKRMLKKWKESEGYYYLNPGKFQFSLKNL